MKFLIGFFLVCVLKYVGLGQEENINSFCSKLENKNLSLSFLDSLLYDLTPEYRISQRVLKNKYSQKYVLLEFDKQYYYLNLLSKKGHIIYLDLRHSDSVFSAFNRSSLQYEELIESHMKKFSFLIDISHQYFNPTNSVFVGVSCGYRARETDCYKKYKKIVTENNLEEARKWCLSLIPEVRCFGALSLYYIQKHGVILSKNDEKLLKNISKEKTVVYSCFSSCEGVEHDESIRYLLEEFSYSSDWEF